MSQQIQLTNEDWLAIEREYCSRSLSNYIKQCWSVIEPAQPYVHGWHIDAIAEHLEAVTSGEIIRLAIAVPPGMMKSLMVGVIWPSWEWGPKGLSSYRYLGTSHSERLAVRDNMRARRLIQSDWYQKLWGDKVVLMGDQNAKQKFENTATGFREAMPFTSLTGSRGDRVLADDPMSVDDAKSDAKRTAIIQTFEEALPTRLNNPKTSAIVGIQQRLHVKDVIGIIEAKNLGYEVLMLPMEYDKSRACVTSIGFKDPRTKTNELLFPERFPREVVDRDKRTMGSYAVASQFQQLPIPRGGGMFKREWFEIVTAVPIGVRWVRGWDLAATDAADNPDAAYTAGVKLGIANDGTIYVGHAVRGQLSSGKVTKLIGNTASQDGYSVPIDLPQDPGQAGKSQVRAFVQGLMGYTVHYSTESGDKETRAQPFASQAEAGNVKIVQGSWNEAYLDEIETFPAGAFKDQVDATSRAFARLIIKDSNDEFGAPIIINGDGDYA